MLKQPGYGQIKRADTPINEISSLSNNQIMQYKNSPRRLRAKYTHRTNLWFILCVFRSARLMPDTAISS